MPFSIPSTDDQAARENVEVQGAKTYVVREGFKALTLFGMKKQILLQHFPTNSTFPNTFKPEEDKNGNGVLDFEKTRTKTESSTMGKMRITMVP